MLFLSSIYKKLRYKQWYWKNCALHICNFLRQNWKKHMAEKYTYSMWLMQSDNKNNSWQKVFFFSFYSFWKEWWSIRMAVWFVLLSLGRHPFIPLPVSNVTGIVRLLLHRGIGGVGSIFSVALTSLFCGTFRSFSIPLAFTLEWEVKVLCRCYF